MIRYRECRRNHAAHLGDHVVDGCGEFMPAGKDGTPLALKCAACDCHRNFHRKETEGEATTAASPLLLPLPPPVTSKCYISFNGCNPHKQATTVGSQQPRSPVLMNFGGGAAAESSSEDLIAGVGPHFGVSKKRFRTKFTEEQKEKMMGFAERIGWRIQKQEEMEVQRFCAEVGVNRHVFKVWLHNNKQAVRRKRS